MQNTALLIIDVQVAMFSYENTKLYKGNEVLANIKKVLEAARKTNIPAVFIQHTEDEEYTKGLPTWEICKEVAPLNNEKVVEKSSCDSFHQTELQIVLQDLGIKNLIIMGMQSEFCIDTTCRRAFSRGYNCILIKDAHSTFDSEMLTAEQIISFENRVLGGKPDGRFVKLKTAHEIIDLLK
ncbi:MAG: amidase [Bacillales bacterium]|jgi:nicotinamidase-related amidase|nr:amidase [Bacillales bacterium]